MTSPEKLIAEAARLQTTERIELRSTVTGYAVASDAAARSVRHKCIGHSNRSFSRALGYAVRWAAELRCELVDKTGRISAEDCAALVAAAKP